MTARPLTFVSHGEGRSRFRRAVLAVVLAAVWGCRSEQSGQPPPPAPSPAVSAIPTPAASAPPTPAPFDRPCGNGPGDWCAAPPGDPCGAHKDVAACRADPRCGGMRYHGESMVSCTLDSRGFGTNCPTVGCVSLAR